MEGKSKQSNLRSLTITCDHCALSDRAAFVTSAVLEDVGVTEETGVIHRNEIRRARSTARTEIQTPEKVTHPATTIFFDGRKDKTLTEEGKGKTQRRRTIKEDITNLQGSSSKYVGHVSHPQERLKVCALEYSVSCVHTLLTPHRLRQ